MKYIPFFSSPKHSPASNNLQYKQHNDPVQTGTVDEGSGGVNHPQHKRQDDPAHTGTVEASSGGATSLEGGPKGGAHGGAIVPQECTQGSAIAELDSSPQGYPGAWPRQRGHCPAARLLGHSVGGRGRRRGFRAGLIAVPLPMWSTWLIVPRHPPPSRCFGTAGSGLWRL